MEVTASHLVGIVFMYIGASIVLKGEVNFEYGITNGAKRTKFIKSKTSKLVGNSAKLVGVFIVLAGVAVSLFVPSEQVLFTI